MSADGGRLAAYLSPTFTDDTAGLSDAAMWLHVAALYWCARHRLTVRRILAADLSLLRAVTPEAAGELVAAGLWSVDGDAYRIGHEHAAVIRGSAGRCRGRWPTCPTTPGSRRQGVGSCG